MPDKYSLRVELPVDLAEKLKSLSAKKAINMTDWIRSQIAEAPDVAPDVEGFKAKYPRLFAKLLFWTKKRLCKNGAFFTESERIDAENHAFNQVQNMLSEIVFAENEQALKSRFDFYDRFLSHQEKTCLGDFFPFLVPFDYDETSWFQKTNWYNLENGEYITLKEQVVSGFNYKGNETGLITVNSYDAQILNSPNMMIIDVDLIGESSLPTDPVITPYQSVALAALKAYQHENLSLGFRVYKTAGGLRYICTTEMFDPTDRKSDFMMRQLFADPKYRNLCRFQETYRARLTPKPWRLGINDLEDCKVCELIDVVGPNKVIDQFSEMVKYHDEETMGKNDLILA
jgi:hypothetical protein